MIAARVLALFFGLFFSSLFCHFLFLFLYRFFIDFGPLRLLKTIEKKHNTNSTFSCFEKVFILYDFWPPKMSLGGPKIMFFGVSSRQHACVVRFLFFL